MGKEIKQVILGIILITVGILASPSTSFAKEIKDEICNRGTTTTVPVELIPPEVIETTTIPVTSTPVTTEPSIPPEEEIRVDSIRTELPMTR